MTPSVIEQVLTLWVVIDPIGTIPVFIAVAAGADPAMQARLAAQATLIAAGVLMTFVVAGQFVIAGLGISLPAFQLAGGVILFLFALTMIFGESKPEAETADATEGDARRAAATLAVFPLAMPSIASPGAMLAVVLLTDNNRFSIPEQAVTAAILLAVLAAAYLAMRTAGPILRLIGAGGAAIVSRVMGMILASVAADNAMSAVFDLIELRFG